jgi:hypothetical protein
MAINAYRYDRVEVEGYVPSDEINWGSVPPPAMVANSGVKTCHRVQGVWVVSDGVVCEGREVRKFGADSKQVGYNVPVVIIGSVAKAGGKWVAYTNVEKVGVYRTRAQAAAAVYAATR